MKRNCFFLSFFMIFTSIQSFSQQASLTIINKSNRQMTTKILNGTEKKAIVFKTVIIAPKEKEIIYFSETGKFFTKTQAILVAKDTTSINDTLFTKSTPFSVIADKRRGYSNITIKFTVKESRKPLLENAFPITRKEYLTD